jgi:hypothetical protein
LFVKAGAEQPMASARAIMVAHSPEVGNRQSPAMELSVNPQSPLFIAAAA